MKKRLAVLFAAVSLLITGVLALQLYQRRWRSEPGLLTDFFPVFNGAEDFRWKTGNYDSFFSCPGPSSTWIKCYISLPAATVNQLLQKDSWTPAASAPYRIEPCPDYPLEDAQWLYNENSSDIMMPRFVGWVYLDVVHNVAYLYAEFA